MNTQVFSFKNVQLVILKVDEWKDKFPQKLYSKKNESIKRTIEKEGVQFLLSTYLPEHTLNYNSNGKPFLEKGGFVSISHSKSLIGLAWSFDYNIGIDIEEIHERILKVEQRFIHEDEIKYCVTIKDKIKLWSIKEALIKIYDNKTFNLKNDLYVKKINSKKWIGYIVNNPSEIHKFSIFEFENNIICLNTQSEE
jgi:hypothetical protein